jgi:tripartite ATP-independent transporter DctP family solute receptor
MKYARRIEQFCRASSYPLLVLYCCLALTLQLSSASAAEVHLYFAHNGGPGSLYEACANEYTKRVNAKLPSGYRLIAAGDSSLGDSSAILDKLKTGEIAMAISSTAMSTLSDKFGIFELPFLIRDRAQIQRVGKTLLDQYLQPEARKNGYRILAIWENGFRHITNNVRPIKRPEDIRGLRIRIPRGPWREKIFKALGADPVPMALHETYAALSTGTIDGQENPLQQVKGQNFGAVQSFLTFSEHVYTPAYVVVGDAAFSWLPPAVQQVLAASALEMQDWVYRTALRIESNLIDELEEQMQTNQLDIKAFAAATRPLYGEFLGTVEDGAKMLDIATGISEGVR